MGLCESDLKCANVQGGSYMTGTDLCINKPQSVPVIFETPCIYIYSTFFTYCSIPLVVVSLLLIMGIK